MIKINTRVENRVQAEAIQRMTGNELELIKLYAANFRRIITDFKRNLDRLPSADDLIWIESETRGHDITE